MSEPKPTVADELIAGFSALAADLEAGRPVFAWAETCGGRVECRSVPGYVCRVEMLDDAWWFAAVSKKGEPDYLLHSVSDAIIPLNLRAARRLCELVVRADLAGAVAPGPRAG